MPRIHVLHENPLWLPPFAEALDQRGLPWTEWDLSGGAFDLSSAPPPGVFYNRMSASSHTRGNRYAAEFTAAVLAWLKRHGRTVVNGPAALDLEISKARQYAALEAEGVPIPATHLVRAENDGLLAAARAAYPTGPFILKPNRGGKGLGVRLFPDADALAAHLGQAPEDEAPVDGLWLLQDYVQAERPVITRAEFVGGRFLYAVQVDTSAGFELCPAEACAIPDNGAAIGDLACPVGETPAPTPRFRILPDGVDAALRRRLETVLAAHDVQVAGVEFIRTVEGRELVYDLNTNTNYNPEAEAAAGLTGTDRSGPGAVAAYLGAVLNKAQTVAAAA